MTWGIRGSDLSVQMLDLKSGEFGAHFCFVAERITLLEEATAIREDCFHDRLDCTWSATMFRKVVQAKVTSTWSVPRFSPKKTWFVRPGHRLPLFHGPAWGPLCSFEPLCAASYNTLCVPTHFYQNQHEPFHQLVLQCSGSAVGFFPPRAAMSLGRPWPCCRFTRCPSLDHFWWVLSTADRDDPTRPVKAAQIH